jgi:hypothetical protein
MDGQDHGIVVLSNRRMNQSIIQSINLVQVVAIVAGSKEVRGGEGNHNFVCSGLRATVRTT